MSFKLEPTGKWEKDHKHYLKKRPNELAAVIKNLTRYQNLIEHASNPRQVYAGFIHTEPKGIVALDQKGGGQGLQQTRLYVYLKFEKDTIYLLAIGDKQSQHSDLEYCKAFVDSLKGEV